MTDAEIRRVEGARRHVERAYQWVDREELRQECYLIALEAPPRVWTRSEWYFRHHIRAYVKQRLVVAPALRLEREAQYARGELPPQTVSNRAAGARRRKANG